MRIKTALILCAGLGKRLYPITEHTPKPLLKIKDLTLLDRTIVLIEQLNIKKILINSFYLKEQINEFVKNHNYKIDIQVIDDGKKILDTGGGILNLISKSDEEDFLIFNPDTIWNKDYVEEISHMINLYFDRDLKNILLLANKDLSFDQNLKGDFGLNQNSINNDFKSHIYIGCQIVNKIIFKNETICNFSITKIWLDLIRNKQLNGYDSQLKFYHATNLEIFKKLQDL